VIGSINNFSLYSQDLESGTTTFIFSFDTPTGDIGGYYLYQSYDNIIYTPVKFLIDYSHFVIGDDADDYTQESNSTAFFTYNVGPGITDGRLLYFKIQGISVANDLSPFSDIEQVYTAPTKPSNYRIIYDGYDVKSIWDELSTESGRNSSLLNFSIYRKGVTKITSVEFDSDTTTATHASFEVGSSLWVIDIIKRAMWFSEITEGGSFTLSDSNKITQASDTSNEYTVFGDNLEYYLENPTSIMTVGSTTDNEFIDNSYDVTTRYIYSIISNGTDSQSSEEVKFPVLTVDVTESYPYLRSPGNSDNTILHQSEWKALKEVLVDANYYDKTQYALPYFTHEDYNLKGYLGVSNCKLDVFVNGILNHVTSTGDYGEFDVYFPFKKGETQIYFQARDKFNIKFSRESARYSIRTISLYSWFYTMGVQYAEIEDETENIQTDINIALARYSSFVDMYAPLINFYKNGDEDETIFRTLATEVFKSFEYASYDESLYVVLNAFRNNLTTLDNYEIYFNEDLYNTQQTSLTFTATSTGLTRGNYFYGVSAYNSFDGSETDVSTIQIDRRWWPNVYTNVNVLMWDYMPDADYYRIYRGYTSTGLYFMTSTGANIFVDTGIDTPDMITAPRLYNYTSLDKPTNLRLHDKYGVNNLYLRLKKPTSLVIILYGTSNNTLEDYNLQRLLTLFEKLIPPEILYRVIFANDEKVILYPEGEEIDLEEDPLVYAFYDLHNYDGDEVYS
jgi:hypothetical protein